MDEPTRVDAFTFEASKVFGDELKRSLAVLKGAGWRIVKLEYKPAMPGGHEIVEEL